MVNVISQTLEYYLNSEDEFSVYSEETRLYKIVIPELPGCMSQRSRRKHERKA